jgi:16S rRNA (uracil1498-N3)-methyltransferase
MADPDFNAPRLFVEEALAADVGIALDAARSNYLRNVMRLGAGDRVHVFNGRDGEWAATIREAGKRSTVLGVETLLRPQPSPTDLWYVFAPLKHARLDYMVQKAVEMGASRLVPVMTRRTQASRVNIERMQANAVEAAEQCGILSLPQTDEPRPLDRLLAEWPADRTLVFCDEGAEIADPIAPLQQARLGPLAVLIGPEGGFDDRERAALIRVPGCVRISLGPRILRADTAAVAALTLVQAVLGDIGAAEMSPERHSRD